MATISSADTRHARRPIAAVRAARRIRKTKDEGRRTIARKLVRHGALAEGMEIDRDSPEFLSC
jgi:hypothetical protein